MDRSNLGKRGKYRFGLLEVGQFWISEPGMSKASARSYVYSLNQHSDKRFRLLSDKQGFVVLRAS